MLPCVRDEGHAPPPMPELRRMFTSRAARSRAELLSGFTVRRVARTGLRRRVSSARGQMYQWSMHRLPPCLGGLFGSDLATAYCHRRRHRRTPHRRRRQSREYLRHRSSRLAAAVLASTSSDSCRHECPKPSPPPVPTRPKARPASS
eukprot:3639850-Prymnesium_polylepis.2